MFATAGHGSNAPAVIRLYGMDSEVDRMPRGPHKPTSTFDREGLMQNDLSSLKSATKTLYRTFLASFDGIVCCTPIAASNFQFRSSFRPDIVLIDEGGRLLELELLVLVAWYSGPWVVVGDKFQLAPYVQHDPSANNAAQSKNLFVRQISYSTIARATDAGVTKACLRLNHRALGSLVSAPSTIICRDYMDTPEMERSERFSPSVQSLQRILRRIRPDLKRSACSLLVSMPGSWVGLAGTSPYNLAHVRWALRQVVTVLREDAAKSSRMTKGIHATVLVMPFYRAQLEKYQPEFRKLVESGEVPKKDAKRVKFATLDSSQGDEADFCIVDLVHTDFLGFTGDKRRLCLMLTRARQAQIILASPGTFVGMQKSSQTAARSAVIRRMYSYSEAAGSVASVPACVFCEMPTPGHKSEDCPIRGSKAAFVKREAKVCRLHGEHNAKDCPRVSCRNCRAQGHRTSACPDPIPCANCFKAGHVLDQCPKLHSCHFYGDMSHRTWECESVCKLCY